MLKSLIPRLNYKFSLKDVLINLKGIFKKDVPAPVLKDFFYSSDIYFLDYARTGLFLILRSLGLEKNSKIGVISYNCHTVFNSIKQAHFTPVFIDVNDDFTINLKDLASKSHEFDVLIVTHLFGIPADIKLIKAKFPEKIIIEDCAHSFLSNNASGNFVGNDGDFSVFSLGFSKFPAVGRGGFIVINNSKFKSSIEKELINIAKYSYLEEAYLVFYKILMNFIHKPIIYNYLTYKIKKNKSIDYSEIDKKLIVKQIPKPELYLYSSKIKNVLKLKEIQNKNSILIKKSISLPETSNGKNDFMIPVLIKKERDKIISLGIEQGVELGKHFSNSIEWAKIFGYQTGDCPNAEKISQNIITIPCHYNLNMKQIVKINNFLKSPLIKNYI